MMIVDQKKEDDIPSVLSDGNTRDTAVHMDDVQETSLKKHEGSVAQSMDITPIQKVLIEYPKNDYSTASKLHTRESMGSFSFPQNNFITSEVSKWFYDHRRTPKENVMLLLRMQYLTTQRREEKMAAEHWQIYV